VADETGVPLSFTVHDLRVTLLDVAPTVWRRLRVPSAISLSVLHAVLQIAFGWEDRHLHEWRVGDVTYGPANEEAWGDDLADESAALLGELAPADSVLHYDYDLGDRWEHLVEVLSVDAYDGGVVPVALLEGARAAPPEDCGGPGGYEHVIDALADPADEEHDAMVAWLGDSFDPRTLDIPAVNHRLEALWRAW
jgi:hypothetical protein